MDTKEKLAIVEELLDVDEGTVTEDTVLEELDEWDSMTILSLMVYFDEELSKKISGDEIKELKTVKDIMDLM